LSRPTGTLEAVSICLPRVAERRNGACAWNLALRDAGKRD